MITLLLLLLATVPLSDGCLKIGYSVPPACACKALGLTSSNVRDYVKESSQYYQRLITGTLRAPVISIDDCVISMICQGNEELIVFDGGDGEEYLGAYPLDGYCNPYGQFWEIAVNEEFKTFNQLYGACLPKLLPDVTCSPRDNATFLFAQSTDVYGPDAKMAMEDLIEKANDQYSKETRFQTIGYVRFDMNQKEEVAYYNGWSEAPNMMPLIEREQGLDSINGGSDVLQMIDRFIDTSPHTVCGAYIQILMGRYPEQTDIAWLVEKIRKYHIYLAIHLTTHPVDGGGSHPETMYNLAIQTNGFCGHGTTDPGWDQPNVFTSYIVYSKNQAIPAGSGTIALPQLDISTASRYNIHIALQGPWYTDSFRSMNISWSESLGSSGSYSTTKDGIMRLHGRTNTGYWLKLEQAVYDMKLDYNYVSANTMLIRVMSDIPVDYWLPYVN